MPVTSLNLSRMAAPTLPPDSSRSLHFHRLVGKSPSPKVAEELRTSVDFRCSLEAEILSRAKVPVLKTGAGFRADSGLAGYDHVANGKAYCIRNRALNTTIFASLTGSHVTLAFWEAVLQ